MRAHIVLENVSVRLPNRLLFDQVNWTLYEGMRVALAGRNGSGKSTLLRIMANQTEPTDGRCNYVGGRKLKIGFLDQTQLEHAVATALSDKHHALSSVRYIQEKMLPKDIEIDPAEQEWEIRKTLSGLGFNKEWMDMPYSHLSGGWLLRIFIAGTLLQKPEVLLLDEPTNHLDLSSIQWLEEFLQTEYDGSLVLVTHDVALQKRVTDSIAIIHGGKFFFRTHQSDYLTFRESLIEEKRVLEKNIEATKKRIDENMEFVYKFRAKAQTAARAQSKLKIAEELTQELNDLKDRLARIEGASYHLKFRFRLAGPGGKFPVSLKNTHFRYKEDGPWILKDISLDVKRGQRVAILGDNGAGKTTLLNVLAERLKITSGEIQKGYAIELGYFGQHQLEELSLENTVLDNLREKASGVSYEEVRGWLGAFGFATEEEVTKKAKVLSGGEKARLALLRILVTRINLCLLDEPTNHLDVETKQLLKTAIRDFEGTTIFVSHDRDFVSDIADRIFYLTSDHQLVDHFGDLESFFEKYPQYVRHVEGRALPSQAPMANPVKTQESNVSTLSYEERKKVRNAAKSMEKKVSVLEAEIEKLGQEKNTLQEKLESLPAEAQGDFFKQLSQVESTLNSKMVDWDKLSSDLEQLRAKLGISTEE